MIAKAKIRVQVLKIRAHEYTPKQTIGCIVNRTLFSECGRDSPILHRLYLHA